MPDTLSPVNFELQPDGSVVGDFWTELLYQTGPRSPVVPFGPVDVAVTATTEATAQLVQDYLKNLATPGSGPIFSGDPCMFEFFAPAFNNNTGGGRGLRFVLWDDDAAASLGILGGTEVMGSSANDTHGIYLQGRQTPAAGRHHYSVRAFVYNGAGPVTIRNGGAGPGAYFPIHGRILERT